MCMIVYVYWYMIAYDSVYNNMYIIIIEIWIIIITTAVGVKLSHSSRWSPDPRSRRSPETKMKKPSWQHVWMRHECTQMQTHADGVTNLYPLTPTPRLKAASSWGTSCLSSWILSLLSRFCSASTSYHLKSRDWMVKMDPEMKTKLLIDV